MKMISPTYTYTSDTDKAAHAIAAELISLTIYELRVDHHVGTSSTFRSIMTDHISMGEVDEIVHEIVTRHKEAMLKKQAAASKSAG